jgi:uncharacterized protein (DUF433 family)
MDRDRDRRFMKPRLILSRAIGDGRATGGYNLHMDAVVSVNQNIQGGMPCFAGTRVPVASLFDHLEGGYTIDYFLTQFPSVKREQVLALIDAARRRSEEESLAAARQ